VVFAGGDGWVYAFQPQDGKLIWKFNANRPADSIDPGQRINNIIATPVIHQDRVYIGVGNDPEAGDGTGRLWVIDATQRGDITEKGVVWSRGGEDYRLTLSTVAIQDGLLYASDLSGFLYCLDAATGRHHWTYDAFAAIWGSPLVADGKVYLADEDGDVAVLKAGTKLEEIAEINMGNSILTTPTAQDGVLYIATREKLFAIGN
ncbi:MAG: PQQ-binding-like beta-propeller repeat protein, partial [Acidobacteriota bacterium]